MNTWMAGNKPDAVILCAAKVGGIHANATYPAEFIYQNMMIEANAIHAAYQVGVEKLLFLGSSCIYPKNCQTPIKEDYLMTGALEPTNEAYAMAKIAGIKLCQSYRKQYGCNFISVMPTNLYGPYDNFHEENAHLAAALINRIHQAKTNNDKEFLIWGTGKPRREFLYIDDLADALVFLLQHYSEEEIINVGSGHEISVLDYARLVSKVVGYKGEFVHDTSKPDGVMSKVMDVSRINKLGWKSKTSLEDGLRHTYEWYLGNINHLRAA